MSATIHTLCGLLEQRNPALSCRVLNDMETIVGFRGDVRVARVHVPFVMWRDRPPNAGEILTRIVDSFEDQVFVSSLADRVRESAYR
jgi:hypothetical protein